MHVLVLGCARLPWILGLEPSDGHVAYLARRPSCSLVNNRARSLARGPRVTLGAGTFFRDEVHGGLCASGIPQLPPVKLGFVRPRLGG